MNIEHRNGSKLFTVLEKDLLGTVKLYKQVASQSSKIEQLKQSLE